MSPHQLTADRPRRIAGLIGLLIVATVVTCAALVSPSAAAATTPLTPAAGAYFGPILDWTADSARGYANRLGATPALYGQSVHFPLQQADDGYLEQFVHQVADQGSLALLDLEPTVALTAVTPAMADHLADQLASLHRSEQTDFYVRFAPEMNGSWKSYGQQPASYVRAFRIVASAVHQRLGRDAAALVWAPAYGAGYPFTDAYGRVTGSGPRVIGQLDTNGDGRVTDADDPYAPYYPGDQYVDWVGLSLYDYGIAQRFGSNVLPVPGRVAGELRGDFGYANPNGAGRDFVTEYAAAKNKRMLIETGALYDPSRPPGPGELAIKQGWWQQVLDPAVRRHFPQIAAIAWLEQQRVEPEVGSADIDWRATHTTELARALHADLRSAGVALGPVLPIQDLTAGNTATAQAAGAAHGGDFGWVVLGAAILLVLYLASGIAARWRPGWRYPDTGAGRDRRVDLFRGWIIVAVVITHIEVAGPYSYVTLNLIGAITGAEMFVLLSGVVLGMVYPLAIARLGELGALRGIVRRAARLYLVAVAVVLLVFALSYLPGVATEVVTTFTDRGTGAAGGGAVGRVYNLYPNALHLLDYPPPGYVVRDLLLLRIGPWPINILGLFVVLTLLVPALIWLLRRRLWPLLLLGSWVLYLLDRGVHLHVFHAQFEDPFPLLTWQIAFTHGLVIGYYRRQIINALSRGLGKLLISGFVVLYCGGLVLLWLVHQGLLTVPGLSAQLYDSLAAHGYLRVFLQPGRLLDLALMLVVAYAFLTAFWRPVSAAFGWFYEPLGQHSLYVFIVHVFFVLAVGSIVHLDRHSDWQGAVVHTMVLALIWLMVRTRFLFRVIPT